MPAAASRALGSSSRRLACCLAARQAKPQQASFQAGCRPALGRSFSSEAGPGGGEPQSSAVVLSKRLPQDFVENTLMPHLEAQLLDSIHVYTPAELCQIARTYSKQDIRQTVLVQKLSDTVKYRMDGFEAVDLVDILGPIWIMIPSDDELFEMLEQRILLKLDDFTALNMIGVIRIFNKRASKHHALLEKVVPRLRELLGNYEGVELSEMLVSMAQSAEAATDMDVLMALVPEIERRYDEVSLVHAINNVWALTQLRMRHEGLLARVAQDLNHAMKAKDLTPGYMARIAWVYRRCNAWEMVSESILPLIRASAAEFRCGEFARLAQALPEEQQLLQRIADLLQLQLSEMGRKDFLLFFLGCIHGELLESPIAGKDLDPLTVSCLEYVREEQDSFKREEIQKIVYLLQHASRYRELLDELPASWAGTREETLDFIKAKG